MVPLSPGTSAETLNRRVNFAVEPAQSGDRDSQSLTAHAPTDSLATRVGDYRDRIARLSDKLCVLHEGLDNDRSTRFEHLQGKVRHLDERLTASQDSGAKKFALLKQQLVGVHRDLDQEREHRVSMEEAKHHEVSEVNAALQAALNAEQEARKETEANILKVFEAKTDSLKEELEKAGRLRGDTEANLRRYLEFDIPKLYESLKEEVDNREAMEQRMLRVALEEVTQLQSAILAEKKAREDSEEAMLRMMEDVVTKMQGEIAAERRERERTEEMLLNLLHDTCSKLEKTSRAL